MVIIDAGHGGFDPGGGSNKYFSEKDKNLEISKYISKRLTELGIDNLLVRSDDEFLDPDNRIKRILNLSDNSNDILISNHVNNGGSSGGEVIYSIRSSAKLAKDIGDELELVGLPIRDIYTKRGKTGNDFYFVLRKTPFKEAVIIEYGFADNEADTDRLIYEWPILAEATVKGIAKFLNVKYKKPKTIYYIVKPGDTLYKLANISDQSVGKIKLVNNLSSDTIYPGTLLKL